MTKVIWLIINSIALAGYAIFLHGKFEPEIFSFLLLGLPFLDSNWKFPISNIVRPELKIRSVLLLIVLLIVSLGSQQRNVLLISILFVALPEEWFFRAYYLDRLSVCFNNALLANVITSMVFAVLHLPMHGVLGLLVFFPSILFGWLYQKYNDLILVIFIHALFNLVYLIYLRDAINGLLQY